MTFSTLTEQFVTEERQKSEKCVFRVVDNVSFPFQAYLACLGASSSFGSSNPSGSVWLYPCHLLPCCRKRKQRSCVRHFIFKCSVGDPDRRTQTKFEPGINSALVKTSIDYGAKGVRFLICTTVRQQVRVTVSVTMVDLPNSSMMFSGTDALSTRKRKGHISPVADDTPQHRRQFYL